MPSNRPLSSLRPVIVAALLAATAWLGAADDKPLKLALICAGSVTDGGWTQLAKEGMDVVKTKLGATVSIIQKVSQDKAGDEMRDYAADHYDLVIAHGYEFLNPAVEAAKSAPATRFAVSGADLAKPGIVTIDFDLSQASYQLGIIAGTLTRSGKLGFIGGGKFPSVQACYRGFLAGAKSVRADVTVAEAYTSWDQPEQSKSQSESFIKEGIDLIYPDVDAASRGVFEAIKEHNAKNAKGGPVYVFGCVGNANDNPVCPEFTLASAIIKLDNAFLRVAGSVKDGSFAAGVDRENIATGTCVAVLNAKLLGTVVSAELLAAVETAGKKLVAGTITIPQR